MTSESVLCNQGCGTHVIFINRRPYNLDKKTPHSETCLSLKFGKFWGGKYDTIPMGYILESIEQAYRLCSNANKSRNIDEILWAFRVTIDNLQRVTFQMEEQHKKNVEWDAQFEDYKINLVKEQNEREGQKHHQEQYSPSGVMDKPPRFVRGDELWPTK